MESAKELCSVADGITTLVDAELRQKIVHKKFEPEDDNSQHVILNDMTQLPQL